MSVPQPTARRLSLGALLGSGGQGAVFELSDDPGRAFKRYHAPTAAHEAKVTFMVKHPPRNPTESLNHPSLAWPLDVVREDGRFAGFVMPRLRTTPLVKFYNPSARLSGLTWRHLVRTAENLAAAVAATHAVGYVIGDLSDSNVLASRSALVTLLDCDSMQVVRPDGTILPCTAGRPEFLAPEYFGVDLSTFPRRPSGDCFSLAVLIWHLLMEGVHPFFGVWTGDEPQPAVREHIQEGRFPHADGSALRPPPGSLPLTTLPGELQQLFIRAFVDGARKAEARPTAVEWQNSLQSLELTLERCGENEQHVHPRHLRNCPWCERMALGLPEPFPAGEERAPSRQRARWTRPGVGRPARPLPAGVARWTRMSLSQRPIGAGRMPRPGPILAVVALAATAGITYAAVTDDQPTGARPSTADAQAVATPATVDLRVVGLPPSTGPQPARRGDAGANSITPDTIGLSFPTSIPNTSETVSGGGDASGLTPPAVAAPPATPPPDYSPPFTSPTVYTPPTAPTIDPTPTFSIPSTPSLSPPGLSNSPSVGNLGSP